MYTACAAEYVHVPHLINLKQTQQPSLPFQVASLPMGEEKQLWLTGTVIIIIASLCMYKELYMNSPPVTAHTWLAVDLIWSAMTRPMHVGDG